MQATNKNQTLAKLEAYKKEIEMLQALPTTKSGSEAKSRRPEKHHLGGENTPREVMILKNLSC